MNRTSPTLDAFDAPKRLDLCTFCPNLCLDVCPVSRATGNSTWSPWGKVSLLTWLQRKEIHADASVIDALWRCVGCQACTTLCDHDQPVSDMLFEARGLYEHEHGTQNVAPDRDAELLAAAVPERFHEEHALACYLPGVTLLRERPGAVAAAFRVLETLGIDDVAVTRASLLDDGSVARERGATDEALRLGKSLAQLGSRYKELLVHDAHALRQLKTWLPQQDIFTTARVWGLAEGIEQRLQRRRATPFDVLDAETRRVVWHDACLHARAGDNDDNAAARRLFERAAGFAPVDPVHHKEEAWCCGRGASFSHTHPDSASSIADLALAEARDLGAELIVSSCPGAAASLGARDIPALGVIEYLDERLHGRSVVTPKKARAKSKRPSAKKR